MQVASTTSRCSPDLLPNVDPCGENGEFHTFGYAGPIFGSPLRCRRGAIVERDGFVFCDLLEQRDSCDKTPALSVREPD